MKKVLLFQVGTIQCGIELLLVHDIKSAKSIITEKTEGHISIILGSDSGETPLYNLVNIFGGKAISHGFENEKLIMVQSLGRRVGMIVSSVNQIVSIQNDNINPLSSIFNGPSLLCFPQVLKHGKELILLIAPEGIEKAFQEIGNRQNIPGTMKYLDYSFEPEEAITLVDEVSALSDNDPISIGVRIQDFDMYEAIQTEASTDLRSPDMDLEITDVIPELMDTADMEDELQCEPASFLANFLQNDSDASPQPEPSGSQSDQG